MQDNPKDRRKHTRISIELEAELKLSDKVSFKGKIRNISFSGVYLHCVNSTNMPVGETGLFKLFLQTDPHPNFINFRCQIVRTDESGAGLRFIDIDIEGYKKFKNLMVYNSTESDKLLAELEKHPGLEIYRGA